MKNFILLSILFILSLTGNIFSQNKNWSQITSQVGPGDRVITVIKNSPYGLVVGGDFDNIGGVPNATGIAIWNGTTFQALGPALNGAVTDIEIVGNRIYFCGGFSNAGGNPNCDKICYWDGSNFVSLGAGIAESPHAVQTIEHVSGEIILAGGAFTDVSPGDGIKFLAKWDGSSWSGFTPAINNDVVDIVSVSNDEFYIGGSFSSNFLKRQDNQWIQPGGVAPNGSIQTITEFGSNIYIGGSFTQIGALTNLGGLAVFNGTSYSSLGTGIGTGNATIRAILPIAANNIYIGGRFSNASGNEANNNITKWNGSAFVPLDSGLNEFVHDIYIDRNFIFAGGFFDSTGNNSRSIKTLGVFSDTSNTPIGISYPQLPNTFETGTRAVSGVNITGTNIYTSGTFKPRVYWKKNYNGTWQSSAATNQSTSANFIIGSPGQSVGDTIFYYFAAQNISDYVITKPFQGMYAKNVNTIYIPPSNPSYYVIVPTQNSGNNGQSLSNLYYFANSIAGVPSQPVYQWRDTTGSVNLILNGVAQASLGAGNIDDGRFDLLNIFPSGGTRFFGTTYSGLYVGTNGIISFAPFNPGGTGAYEPPAGGIPQGNINNAIFAFWKDMNFSDPDVPSNRLCYKLTADELIISYVRAPNYNQSVDANDYVTFQVIIRYAFVNSGNSRIDVMYNDDFTGSSFKFKYSTNTLAAHLIGLQGLNSSSQTLTYRYSTGSGGTLSPYGPMFGSNLAVAFGRDQSVLPVELASFTSEVAGSNVKLNWSTISEENNSGFEVERCELSMVNSEWKKVGNVQGNGTTTEQTNYSYEDRNVQSGNYKYRLKQIDYNGNFEYHELLDEVIVGVPNKYNLSQNYPNPFNPATKINFEIPKNVNGQLVNVKLHVYDVTGRMISELVNKQMDAGYYTVDFNAVNLSSGIYFYKLATNDFVQTKKMLLVK